MEIQSDTLSDAVNEDAVCVARVAYLMQSGWTFEEASAWAAAIPRWESDYIVRWIANRWRAEGFAHAAEAIGWWRVHSDPAKASAWITKGYSPELVALIKALVDAISEPSECDDWAAWLDSELPPHRVLRHLSMGTGRLVDARALGNAHPHASARVCAPKVGT